MNPLCLIGLHRWSRWNDPDAYTVHCGGADGGDHWDGRMTHRHELSRECDSCGSVETRRESLKERTRRLQRRADRLAGVVW